MHVLTITSIVDNNRFDQYNENEGEHEKNHYKPHYFDNKKGRK